MFSYLFTPAGLLFFIGHNNNNYPIELVLFFLCETTGIKHQVNCVKKIKLLMDIPAEEDYNEVSSAAWAT